MPSAAQRSRDSVSIRNVIKVSVLGEGCQGTVWTARVRGKQGGHATAPYALKQRLIKGPDAAMRNTKSSSALREIEFYRRVANRHPTVFSRLYDWEITEASPEMKLMICAEGQATSRQGRKDSRASYTHVLTTLSARKEGVLRLVYHELNRVQWLSMLAQVCYGIALIQEKGFSHGDVWDANIAFNRVPWGRDVPIFRGSVPSLGYVWSIIDYGSVELIADEDPKEKSKKRASTYELDDLISLASGEDDAIEECAAEAMDIEGPEFKKQVLSSLDGPSVRETMRKTGLPLNVSLALLNLDSYLWHVCGHVRGDTVKQWADRGALLKLADPGASYAALATTFSRLAREAVKRGEGRISRHELAASTGPVWDYP